MKIVDYLLASVDLVVEHLEKGYQPYGSPIVSEEEGLKIELQAMVKYEEPSVSIQNITSERWHPNLSGLSYMTNPPVNDLVRENEQLKEKILFYESPLSEEELTYDELIKENKRLETIIEILVSNHCQELVKGETVMHFAGDLIKENGDSLEDDIYNITRKIIEKK